MTLLPGDSNRQQTDAASDYRRVTDSAGITAEYRPLRDVRPGDEIVGGWQPWAKVKRVETNGDQGRVYYETHGPTDWFPLSDEFPVAV